MESSVCRLCLKQTGVLSIFQEENQIQYSAMVMKCVNILITEDDGLPGNICINCIQDLYITYGFIQKCESSDRALRDHRLVNEFNVKLESYSQNIKCEDTTGSEEVLAAFTNEYLGLNAGPDDECDYPTELHAHNRTNKKKVKKQKDKTRRDNREVSDDPTLSLNYQVNLESKDERVCNEETTVNREIAKKRVKRNKSGPVQCTVCGLMVNSPSAMKIHARTHSGERPFSCNLCQNTFQTKGSLKRHNLTHHSIRERKFTCETCGNSFFTKNAIITHMRRHTGEKPYECPFCSKRFLQVASLNRHKRTHTGEKPYSCHICDRRFIDKCLVNKHMSVHSEERKFSCHLCHKTMKTKSSLSTHMMLHSNEKQNVCNFCGMAFSMKGNLKIHILRVHSEKSGQCDICLKTFSNLEVHMRKHTGEKPYICDICSKAFGTKMSLSNHMLYKHENVGKYRCSVGECTRSFPTGTMLEFHLLKQHTNHTPYVCQHCARGFFRTSDLSRHLKVSHMDLHLKMPLKIISAS